MFPITSFTASLGHDGNIDIFALDLSPQAPQGQGATVFRIRQKKAGGDWQPWANAGEPGHGAVGVRGITDITGHGHVLADDAAGHLWFNERRPDDTFSGWQALGVPPLAPTDADSPSDAWGFIDMWGVTRTDGQIDVVGAASSDADRGLFLRTRPAHAASWTPWSPLLGDNDFFGYIVAATDYLGGLDIVTPLEVSADAAGLSHKRRLPDGTWTDWTMLGNPPGGLSEDIIPVLVNGADSPIGVDLFAVAVDSTIWHNAQTATGDWSSWASLGNTGGPVTGIAVTQDGGGALNVCATHKNNTVTHRRQEDQGGAWTDWVNLGAPDAGAIANPALICDSEGQLNLLLTRPAEDGMITLRQTLGGQFVKGPAIPALRMATSEVSAHASLPLSFGPRQLVTTAPAIDPATVRGCGTCDGDGVIHAFWSYLDHIPEVDTPNVPLMTYLSGPPDAVSAYPAGDAGIPLAAAADGATVYLLYSNDSGVRLTEVAADGSFGSDRLLSDHPAGQGALVVDQGGWWAEWVEDASSMLFEAYGGWGNGDFPREPVTSELTDILYYDSPTLALGPRDPADPGDRWIHLSWGMLRQNSTTVVRLASRQVQAAGWGEQPWLPTAAMHSSTVTSPALAYEGALQAAYTKDSVVGYMSNPSQSAAPQSFGAAGALFLKIAASGGRTVLAWVGGDGVTSAELWVAGPASPAVKLAAQSIYLNIIGLASYAGNAVLLTFEDDNSVYVRIQTT